MPVAPLLAAAAAALAPAALTTGAAQAAGSSQRQTGQAPYDVRAALPQNDPSAPGSAARALARQLGPQAVVALDPATGTPRQLGRTDGALTGRSGAAPATVALDYVRAHENLFQLGAGELAALSAPATTTTPSGIRVLSWTQTYRGLPVIGAGLRAAVAADGRLLSVGGGPLADASVPSTTPSVTKPAALARARSNAGAGASGGSARLAIFAADDGARLAWSVRVDADSTHRYRYVVDATDGAVLKRDNLVRFADSGHATSVWDYAPSDETGNAPNPRYVVPAEPDPDDPDAPPAAVAPWMPQARTFGEGWITSIDGSRLQGENAHVFSDVDDDDRDDALEEVAANGLDGVTGLPVWDFPMAPVAPFGGSFPLCEATYPCTWRSLTQQVPEASWRRNREQNATQVFWFLNSYKEWLEAAPIGFGAGDDEDFSGEDPVIGQTDDGADLSIAVRFSDGRLGAIDHHPDVDHLNNANMYTPPNGQSPTMQMYLFYGDGIAPDSNGGDDASIVFHEYTHGLSSRLVVDSDGYQALNAPQSGAMGEAWSDWYAMDYLTASGAQKDDPATDGEVLLSSYISGGRTGDLREEAMDCPVDATPSRSDACGEGGFTYADYGKILGGYGPEVHADGEIWGQTLWDLRTELGATYARQLISDAMRISPAEPSFLDMRDAILLADRAAGGSGHDQIWQVFANRGMGYFATTENGWDPAPTADFSVPPADENGAVTSVSGTVTDADSGQPVAGVLVALPGQTDRSDETDAAGRYEIANALDGFSYPRVVATRNGYDDANGPAVDLSGGARSGVNLQVRRNWALYSGAATVDFAQLTGPDLTALGCGPEYAIDGTRANGWGSYAPGYDGSLHAGFGMPVVARGARRLVLRLPATVDVSGFAIDPGAVCGDDDSASLGSFQIETSVDGTTWKTAASQTFGRANNHRRNNVPVAASAAAGVRFVRVTMLSPQGGGSSGAYFMDMAEFALYGTPTRAVDPPDPPDPPDPGPGPDPDPDPGDDTPPVKQPDPGPPVTREPPRRTDPTPAPDPNAEALRLTNAQIVLPKKRSLAAVLSRKGVPVRVRASRRVKVTATVTLPAATARKLRLTRQRKGTVAIARLSNAAVAANKATVLYVRLPRNTVAWIDHARVKKLSFGVALLATDAATGRIASRLLRATAKR